MENVVLSAWEMLGISWGFDGVFVRVGGVLLRVRGVVEGFWDTFFRGVSDFSILVA